MQGISDMLHRTACRVPGKLAIVSGATRLTFAELEAAVSRTAAALTAEGLEKGDRLHRASDNRWQFAVLSFATARIGVILVPWSSSMSVRRRSATSSATAKRQRSWPRIA